MSDAGGGVESSNRRGIDYLLSTIPFIVSISFSWIMNQPRYKLRFNNKCLCFCDQWPSTHRITDCNQRICYDSASMNFHAGCKQLTRSRSGCINCVTNASHFALNTSLSSHYFPCVYAWHDLCGVNFSCGSTASSSCETSLPTSEYYECFCASALCSNCRKALLEIMLYRR